MIVLTSVPPKVEVSLLVPHSVPSFMLRYILPSTFAFEDASPMFQTACFHFITASRSSSETLYLETIPCNISQLSGKCKHESRA